MKNKSWVGLLSGLMLGISGVAQAAFIDHNQYTSITELNIDVWDVSAFTGMTLQEVENQVSQMGNGWRLASMADLNPIFPLLTEEQYLNSVKDMLGYSPVAGQPGLYNTGGRVADIDSNLSDWNSVWGLGNGIMYFEDNQSVFKWSTYGIGWDNANTRFEDQGAWVIRTTPSPIPVPASLALFASAIAGLATARVKNKKSRA